MSYRTRYRQHSVSPAYVYRDRLGNIVSEYDTNYTVEQIGDYNNGRDRPYSRCSHSRVYPRAISATHQDGDSIVYKSHGDCVHVDSIGNYILTNLSEFLPRRKFEFQDNNGFELVNFLGELDETIAMFSLKFAKSLKTYEGLGALQWGALPFLQDMRGLYDTLVDLFSGRLAAELANGRGFRGSSSVDYRHPNGHRASGTIYINGTYSVPDIGAADVLAILLDEIGFHPDLKSGWDLVPMSFLVDSLLPIGDALESLHPRGWWNPVLNFSGNVTIRVHTEYAVYCFPGPYAGIISGDYYRRAGGYSIELPPSQWKFPEYKTPNLRHLFNAAYVLLQPRASRAARKRRSRTPTKKFK